MWDSDCLLCIDYYQSIKLVDPTTTGTNEGITTLLFHKLSTALMEQLRYGDILIVRDARVRGYEIRD